jgi:hypothetical protein
LKKISKKSERATDELSVTSKEPLSYNRIQLESGLSHNDQHSLA